MPITVGFVPYPPGQGAAKKSINNAPYVEPPPENNQKKLTIALKAVPSLPTSVTISALTGSGITVTLNGTATSFIITVYSSSSSLMTSPTQVIQSTVSGSGQLISFSPTDSLYYGVSVQARNQNGLSKITSLTAGSLYTAPPVAPTSITLSSLSGTGATVTWSGGSGAASYNVNIYYNSSASVTTSNSQVAQSPYISVSSGSSFTFTATDISYYAATVTAINAGGQATSSISGAVQYFAAPGQPTVNTPTNTGTTLNMSWTAPASGGSSITSYTVYVLANGSAAPSGTLTPGLVTSTTFSPMVSGTPYSFYVVANGNGGSGTQSSTSSTVTYYTPAVAPTTVTLSALTATGATVTWSGGSGAVSYTCQIYSSSSSNMSSPSVVSQTPSSSTSVTSPRAFTITTTVGLYYGAIVTAVNQGGSVASSMSTGVLRSLTTSYAVATMSSGFSSPNGIALDASNNVYVYNENTIVYLVTASSKTAFAGNNIFTGAPPGGNYPGPGTGVAAYIAPGTGYMCSDTAGNLYVLLPFALNFNIVKITTPGAVVTVPDINGNDSIANANNITINTDGKGYCVGTDNQGVYKLTNIASSSITVSVVDNTTYFSNLTGITNDSAGNLYVCDAGANIIYLTTITGTTTVFAGSGSSTSSDGTGTSAGFSSPYAMCCDKTAGFLYVAESSKIRKIVISSKVVTTIATGFNNPHSIAINSTGTILYVTDTGNNAVKRITITQS
jgi:sugar lactone lactonase YvrE